MAQPANHADSPPSTNGVAATPLVAPELRGQQINAENPADKNNRVRMRDMSPMCTWANIDVTVVYANWF
jgi:hypothetical protein